MRRQKGDLAMAIDDYTHAIEKCDYHEMLRRYGVERGGILMVRLHYDHYRGIAGFVQQSQPNTASVPKVLRQFMVPSNPTDVLVSVDLAQADWNWLQALTLAPSMIAASESGDVYRYVGNRLEMEDISLERQDLKRFVNSLNYGRTAFGLQREWNHLGYKYDAKVAIQAYRSMFPELSGFMRDVTRSRYPFVVDWFERHLDVDLTNSQKAALPAQSGVAAFMKSFDEDMNFFLVRVKLVQIGDSNPAPLFQVEAKPNQWTKQTKQQAGVDKSELTGTKIANLQFFETLVGQGSDAPWSCQTPRAQHWFDISIGTSGVHVSVTLRKGKGQNKVNDVQIEYHIDDDKDFFDKVEKFKPEIESKLGSLDWMRLDDKKDSRIVKNLQIDWMDDEAEARASEVLVELVPFYQVFRGITTKIN